MTTQSDRDAAPCWECLTPLTPASANDPANECPCCGPNGEHLLSRDPDDFLAQEQADRALERGDSPHLWLGPTKACPDCGYPVREVEPGRWICPCHEWSRAA